MTASLLHDLPGVWAERAPDAPCLEMGDGTLTYAEVERTSNRVARALLESGFRRGDRVGIWLPKSFHAVLAMLGTLKAGGAYVPLDPQAPPRRAGAIARDCGMTHLVTNRALLEALVDDRGLPPALGTVVLGDARRPPDVPGVEVRAWDDVEALSAERPHLVGVDPRDLAYVLYTSGSTGAPKGVMLSHRNALAFVEWAAAEFRLGPADRLSNHAPFHFDLTVLDLYGALWAGASMTLIDEWSARIPRRLVDIVRRGRLSVWYSVPSILMLMAECGGLEDGPPPALRLVLFAGEEFPVKHLRRLAELVPGARYVNLYGPTETNVCTFYEVQPHDVLGMRALPIGRACSGDTIHVYGDDHAELPVGQVGELWVEGPTVMMGYWGAAGDRRGTGAYATGDYVERADDGNLIFHGRRDFMVKINGYRVELREVENAVVSHPGVLEAAVTAHQGRTGREGLVAHVVAAEGTLSASEVREHCARILPPYMVPDSVRFCPRLPRTGTGKVDRVRLGAACG